jgi:hypothetical protein
MVPSRVGGSYVPRGRAAPLTRGEGRGFTEAEKGTVLDWGVACARDAAGDYREAAARGQVERSRPPITTRSSRSSSTPPLLGKRRRPRLCPTLRSARRRTLLSRSLARGTRTGALRRCTEGTWPPEGAVNDAALSDLARAGFAWAASDETVLRSALEGATARRATGPPCCTRLTRSRPRQARSRWCSGTARSRIGSVHLRQLESGRCRARLRRAGARRLGGGDAPLVSVIWTGRTAGNPMPTTEAIPRGTLRASRERLAGRGGDGVRSPRARPAPGR